MSSPLETSTSVHLIEMDNPESESRHAESPMETTEQHEDSQVQQETFYLCDIDDCGTAFRTISLLNDHKNKAHCDKNESKTSVAIQANDYEIERGSGKLPARRRIIPLKFRDFHDPEDLIKQEDDMYDEDYDPGSVVLSERKPRQLSKTGRRPGRPRKPRKDHAYEKDNEGTEQNEAQENEQKEPEDSQSQPKDESSETSSDLNQTAPAPRRGRPPKDQPSSAAKVFKCLICNKKFSQKGNLRVHMKTHTDEKPFPCDMESCGKSFRSNESLKRHKMAHMGIKMFECSICEHRFSSNVALKEHISRHTDTKPYKCQYCDKYFRQVSCLRRHTITHTGETPYSCEICGRKFSQLIYVKSHMRSHTGEKPFQCKLCGRLFSHHSDLNRHQTVHTGHKPFECEVCGARFSDPSSRRRHVKEHTGMKAYTCPLCGDAFKRSGQLKAHLNKKHMNYKEEVVIKKSGPFNALEFVFRHKGKLPELSTENAMVNSDIQRQVVEAVQMVNHASQDGEMTQTQLMPSEVIPQSELPNQIILTAPTDDKLLEQTHRILQQITNQSGEDNLQVAYQIIHDDENQQIVEIQYSDAPVVVDEHITITDATSEQEQAVEGNMEVIEHIQEGSHGGHKIIQNGVEIHIEEIISDPEVQSQMQQVEQLVTPSDVKQIQIPDRQEIHIGEGDQIQIQEPQQLHINDCEVQQIEEVQQEVQQDEEGKQLQHQHFPLHEKVQKDEEAEEVQQVQEVQLQEVIQQAEVAHHIQQSQSTQEEIHHQLQQSVPFQPTLDNARSQSSTTDGHNSADYVVNPDFNSQDYYNWLSGFTELCKMVPMPLDVDLFQKISQVHKSISDVLATPKGILTNRENFRTLMNISQELNIIINEHLSFVLQNLDHSEAE